VNTFEARRRNVDCCENISGRALTFKLPLLSVDVFVCSSMVLSVRSFYRAMHFSAKRGIAIACRLSVRPSVTLVNCDRIGWNSSKIISPLVSLGCSLFAAQHDGSAPKGTPINLGPK